MNRRYVGAVLSALVCLNLLVPHQQARAEVCPTYDFKSIFYDDYYPGTIWDNRSGSRNIVWSANASVIHDESVVRAFSAQELEWIRSAFKSWDDALDSVQFTESPTNTQAEIVIGFVNMTSIPNAAGVQGYWNAWWTNNWRNRATIKLKATDTAWFSVRNQFIHAVQHELGNVLGLGDIVPTADFSSVQEDSWQRPFGEIPLSNFDIGLVRQLYGESTCPSTFPNAGAVTPTPSPTPSPTSSPTVSPTTSPTTSPTPTPTPTVKPAVVQRSLQAFPSGATALTAAQRNQIVTAVRLLPGAKKFVCTGIRFESAPMSENITVRSRAKAACDFAKQINPDLSTWFQTRSTTARSFAGKVLLTITE